MILKIEIYLKIQQVLLVTEILKEVHCLLMFVEVNDIIVEMQKKKITNR